MDGTKPTGFAVKRVYAPPAGEDGERILVDRLWPRGISKDTAKIDTWRKDLAPSNELRRWFGHDPARWDEFRTRYRGELEAGGMLDHLRALVETAASRRVTLLFAAADPEHNNAVALRAILGDL